MTNTRKTRSKPPLINNHNDTFFSKVNPIYIVIGIVIIGTILRIYNLGWNSVWLDEASTLIFARLGFVEIFNAVVGGEFNPPLFYWFEHLIIYFGTSEMILRFIPMIAGIATIPVFYLIGETYRDHRTGIVLSALIAVLPFHIFYSQEARAYSLALLFVSCVWYMGICTVREPSRKIWWVGAGVFTALALWTHFYTLIAIVPVYAILTIITFRHLKMVVASLAVTFSFSFPIIMIAALLFTKRVASPPTYGLKGIDLITGSISSFFGDVWYIVTILTVLFLIGLYFIYRKHQRHPFAILFVILFGFVISFILSWYMPMLPRYLIIMLPGILLPIACAISEIRACWKMLLCTALICCVIAIPLVGYYTSYTKEDWRGVSVTLRQITTSGDTVGVVPGYIRQPLDYYYSAASDVTTEYPINGLDDIINNKKYPGNNYYIITADIYAIKNGTEIITWMDSNTKPITTISGVMIRGGI